MQKPPPLVPRDLRFGVPERMDGRGNVLLPLDEAAVTALAPRAQGGRASRRSPSATCMPISTAAHERRTRDILAEALPGVSITLSSEVSPEIREYERWSTAVANAYVQPVMDRYLGRLDEALRAKGVDLPAVPDDLGRRAGRAGDGAPVPDPAGRIGPGRRRHPGGRRWRASAGSTRCCRFDMGGTTAKICLIDDGEPQHSRTFEVARQYRFLKGSGLPLRIPVIEMVEIGAGGGSIASVDALSAHQRRPGERRRRARPGELRPRRHRAHRDRRRRGAGPHRSRLLRRRHDQALARQGGRAPSTRRSARRSA